jgi:hypothetical protein
MSREREPLKLIWRPIENWPGEGFTPALARRQSHFRADYADTLRMLDKELRALDARSIVIQVEINPALIRQSDDQLHKGAKVYGPAVLLTFLSGKDGERYAYPCDTFDKMTHNLRAIALSLEALRRVDDYGVTRRGEQYQGFRALPPGPQPKRKMKPAEAAAKIAGVFPPGTVSVEGMLADELIFKAIKRAADFTLHPDRSGAPDERFKDVQEAAAILEEHFRQKASGAGT